MQAPITRSHRQRLSRLRNELGQATVEYVGLAVAVAVLLAAVGGGLAGHGDRLASAMSKKLTDTVRSQAQ